MKTIILLLHLAVLVITAGGCATAPEAAAQSVPISTLGIGTPALSPAAAMLYDQLAPYGHWFWLDPYGWVWSPTNVAYTWRPYTDGNWVYTDAGWTWVSHAEWGWAPFHYGRWSF